MSGININTWGDMVEIEEIEIQKPIIWDVASNLSTALDTEDFPSLGEFKEVKSKKVETQKDKVEKSVNNSDVLNTGGLSKKSLMCKTVKNGEECPYGVKCVYAHYDDEVKPNKCNFEDSCYRIKYTKKNIVMNMDNKNPCCYLHPEETITMYIIRHGIKPEKLKRPAPEVIYKYTRMCNSIIDNTSCDSGDECTYAHTFEQLKTSNCMFGDSCHHVVKTDGNYSNAEQSDKKCYYLHPEETRENFKKRIIEKKRHAENNIDTTKIKKIKIEKVVKVEEVKVEEVKVEEVEEVKVEEVKVEEVKVEEVKVEEVKDYPIIVEVDKENAADIIQKMVSCGIKNFQLKIR